MSIVEPALNGQIARIDRLGQACARALRARTGAASAATQLASKRRRCMLSSRSFVGSLSTEPGGEEPFRQPEKRAQLTCRIALRQSDHRLYPVRQTKGGMHAT